MSEFSAAGGRITIRASEVSNQVRQPIMTIRQILAHVEPGESGERRLRYAVSVAQHFHAKLTGLSVRLSPSAMAFAMMGDPQAYAALAAASEETCVGARKLFGSVTEGAGVTIDWREGFGIPAQVIGAEAGCADLLILGRGNQDELAGPLYDLTPADVVLSCGRPVLVVPDRPPEAFRARRILIAWKGTAQATRAVHDALPLLTEAEEVVLAEIASRHDASGYNIPGSMLADHLRAHDVAVTTRTIDQPGDAGALLIGAAQQAGCDMVVAGAYGHSRLREWVLGGVTKTFLDSGAMPFLLSH
jgi:nucleotide-binding universal stress UspA family protein